MHRSNIGASHPGAPGLIFGIPKSLSNELFDIWLRLSDGPSKSVEKLEFVDQTIQYYLVAS